MEKKRNMVNRSVILRIQLAGGGGFEPPLMDPESTVLPLDDPPATTLRISTACHFLLPYQTVSRTNRTHCQEEAEGTVQQFSIDSKSRIPNNLGIVAGHIS